MNWHILTDELQLQTIIDDSNNRPQLIFKHSTRCSISKVIKDRLERKAAPPGIDFYYLDVIAHRSISNKIADHFNVEHESPQVLLISNAECIYHESHSSITMDDIETESMSK